MSQEADEVDDDDLFEQKEVNIEAGSNLAGEGEKLSIQENQKELMLQ